MTDAPTPILRRISPTQADRPPSPPLDDPILPEVRAIIRDVRERGEGGVQDHALRLGDLKPGQPLVLGRDDMAAALDKIDAPDRSALERAAQRIRAFAEAQREAIRPMSMAIPGGRAGHTIEPIQSAGCYAPCGRYPLPSSVLMTAVTARAAGCARVVVASPGAEPVILAAAAIAGADQFLAVGGVQAIAALAFGIRGLDPVDLIVGPGNRWVTAAKRLLAGAVGIDMLAGPSELLILADDSADPALVAGDLLAQAEHDADAVPMLVTPSPVLADSVDRHLGAQLPDLPTREVARAALANGFACVVRDLSEGIEVANRLAPEHLQIHTQDPEQIARRVVNAGALFIGPASAEVIGDYGAGPNHTLPTGRTARFAAGLSVAHFLRMRTWMQIDSPPRAGPLLADTERLARLEGLHAHASAAARRRSS